MVRGTIYMHMYMYMCIYTVCGIYAYICTCTCTANQRTVCGMHTYAHVHVHMYAYHILCTGCHEFTHGPARTLCVMSVNSCQPVHSMWYAYIYMHMVPLTMSTLDVQCVHTHSTSVFPFSTFFPLLFSIRIPHYPFSWKYKYM